MLREAVDLLVAGEGERAGDDAGSDPETTASSESEADPEAARVLLAEEPEPS